MIVRPLIFLILASSLCGCADSGAVGKIATRLTAADESWSEIANEMARSCARQTQFNSADTACLRQKDADQAITSYNRILGGYFQALADASSDQKLTVEPGLTALAESASRVPGVNADQVAAAKSVASLLATLATEGARQKILRSLINQGVPPAKVLVGALRQRVPQALRTTLRAEQDRTTIVFAQYVQAGGGNLDADPSQMCQAGPQASRFSGPNFLLSLEYCNRVKSNKAKLDAVDAYEKSLSDAGSALDELNSSKTNLQGKALASRLYALGRQIDASVSAMRKAFA